MLGQHRVPLVFLCVFLCACLCLPSSTFAKNSLWDDLIGRLEREGIERAYLETIYSHNEVKFEPGAMPKKLLHRERPHDYTKFLRPQRIKKAIDFLKSNKKLFIEVEKAYGVPAPVKAALLLVETDLGNYTGKHRVVNILSSMAISYDIDKISPWLPKDILSDQKKLAYYRKRAKTKSKWALKELKAFFIFCKKNKIDPVTVKGSPFGAFGICQFIPSSALRYAVDYDGDGRVDLFDLDDALASVANYLKQHGWRPGISREKAFRCLLTYNRSRPYANTILDAARQIAEGLKG